ncbi:hypothetical protein TNCV_1021761 [Trichonephila clavipes]|nr:hypothetical protein TNCV_1021761 [Trichonephila clavipes]
MHYFQQPKVVNSSISLPQPECMLLNIGGGRAFGIVVSEADYGAVGAGFESRVRHGCLFCNSPLCDVCLTLTST